MVTGIGEVMAVSISTIAVRKGFGNGIVCVHDPHSRGVGNGRHARFLSLLLLSINDEQRQEEENHQDKNDDARNGPDLVGISRESRTGSA